MEAPHGRTPPQHSASGGCWRTAGLSLPNSPLPSTKDGAVPWVVQGSIPKSHTEGRMRVSAPPRGHLGCLGSGGWPWPRIVRRRDKGQTKSHTPHSGRASPAGLSFAVRRVSFLCKSPGREGRISVFVGEAGGVEKKKREKAQNPTGSTKIRRACEEIPTGTGPGLHPCAGSPPFAPLLLHTLSPEDPRVTILQGQAPSDSGTPEHAATKSPDRAPRCHPGQGTSSRWDAPAHAAQAQSWPWGPAPGLSLPVLTTGESSTLSFGASKGITSISSPLSLRWLTALKKPSLFLV